MQAWSGKRSKFKENPAKKIEFFPSPRRVRVRFGGEVIADTTRAIAEEAEVPVIENPPLAQALYAGVEVGDEIPEQHYRAVAGIIGYVLRLKGKLKPQPGARARAG